MRHIGLLVGATLLATLNLGAQTPVVGTPKEKCPPSTVDDAHPRYFTNIYESTRGQHVYPIYLAVDTLIDSLRTRSSSLPEVDVNSSVRVAFRKEWISKLCLDARILVTGHVISGSNSAPFEVPGYSTIGEKAHVAEAVGRSGAAIRNVLSELARTWKITEAAIGVAHGRMEDSLNRGLDATKQKRLALLIKQRDSVRQSSDSLSKLLAAVRILRDTSSLPVTNADSASRATRATIAARAAVNLQEAIAAAQDRISLIEREMAVVQSLSVDQQKLLAAFVAEAAQQLQIAQPLLTSLLDHVIGDTAQIRILAKAIGRDNSAFTALVTDVRKRLSPIVFRVPSSNLDSVKSYSTALALFREQLNRVRSFAELVEAHSEECVGRQAGCDLIFLSELREAIIPVSSTKGKPGDIIEVTIKNMSRDTVSRDLKVRMLIREFGWTPHVVPAALLLRRVMSEAQSEAQLEEARAGFLASGTPSTVRTPVEVNFAPAAGSTFLWTNHLRMDPNKSKCYQARRILDVSLGLNVSFTTFQTKVVTFKKSAVAAAKPEEDANIEPTSLQVAVGPMLGLFDNAITLGGGANLNTKERRWFAAVGFSFVDIAKGLLGSGDGKGK